MNGGPLISRTLHSQAYLLLLNFRPDYIGRSISKRSPIFA